MHHHLTTQAKAATTATMPASTVLDLRATAPLEGAVEGVEPVADVLDGVVAVPVSVGVIETVVVPVVTIVPVVVVPLTTMVPVVVDV
jgi:hypothetical protein